MPKSILTTTTLAALLAVTPPVLAQDSGGNAVPAIYPPGETLGDLTQAEQALHRRAIEVAIWAQPLVNFKAMYDSLNEAVGMTANGDITYHSQIQDWRRGLPTPNNTTPYVFFFWDLSDGPVVLDIPPSSENVALYGTMMDSWHRPIEEYGERGRDRGRGARYLLLPPDYRGYVPYAGYEVFRQDSYRGFTLMRPLINDKSPDTIAAAVDLVKQVHVYPFSQADNPPDSRHLDVHGLEVDGITKWDETFYRNLHEILQTEFIEEKDLAMMGMLEAMGISQGQPYETDARRDEILRDAARNAHEYMVVRYHGPDGVGMIPMLYEGKHWGPLVPPTFGSHQWAFQYPSHLDYSRRGSLYYAIFSSIKHYGPGSFYLDVAQDSDGEWLFGSNNYQMTVPANVPVSRFWALTAYDLKTAAFLREVPSQGVSSIDDGLEVNEDGTVTLYIGPEAPKGNQANWVPTREGDYFYMLFRFYGAENSVFTKEWQLEDVVKVQ
jgi:hypothetical protein